MLNVVVIGTGMYVCGRGTDEYGTVLPALGEWKRTHGLDELYLVGATPEGIRAAHAKLQGLERTTGVSLSPCYMPSDNRPDPQGYLEAVRRIPKPACAIVAVPDALHRDVAMAAP